jgi:hypothetical protein
MFFLIVVLTLFLELIVEEDCEPSQFLCSCDHVIKKCIGFLTKSIYSQPLLFSSGLSFPETKEP